MMTSWATDGDDVSAMLTHESDARTSSVLSVTVVSAALKSSSKLGLMIGLDSRLMSVDASASSLDWFYGINKHTHTHTHRYMTLRKSTQNKNNNFRRNPPLHAVAYAL